MRRALSDNKYHVFIIPQTFGFSSPDQRERLIKRLHDRINSVQWQDIVEDVCERVISHCRAGEPEVAIDSASIVYKQPEYLLYPFIPKNQPSIIVGKKGSCKSTLAALMAVCVVAGWHDNPFGFENISKDKKNVLWLDWETDQEGFEYDIKRLCEGNGLVVTKNIFYQHCRGPISNLAELLKAKCTRLNIALVVVDSIAPASGGEIKEAGAAIDFHNTLRYLNCTSLSLGHPTKSEQKETSVTGAGQFEDLARNIWEATWDQEVGEDVGHQALWHRKNYKTGYLKPRGLQFAFTDEVIVITQEDPKQTPKFLEKMSDSVKIMEYLKSGAKPLQAIVEVLDKKPNHISVLLNRLKKSGKIIRLETGQWGLLKYPDISS